MTLFTFYCASDNVPARLILMKDGKEIALSGGFALLSDLIKDNVEMMNHEVKRISYKTTNVHEILMPALEIVIEKPKEPTYTMEDFLR